MLTQSHIIHRPTSIFPGALISNPEIGQDKFNGTLALPNLKQYIILYHSLLLQQFKFDHIDKTYSKDHILGIPT